MAVPLCKCLQASRHFMITLQWEYDKAALSPYVHLPVVPLHRAC